MLQPILMIYFLTSQKRANIRVLLWSFTVEYNYKSQAWVHSSQEVRALDTLKIKPTPDKWELEKVVEKSGRKRDVTKLVCNKHTLSKKYTIFSMALSSWTLSRSIDTIFGQWPTGRSCKKIKFVSPFKILFHLYSYFVNYLPGKMSGGI